MPSLQVPKLNKDVAVSTETVQHRSEAVNYGRVIPLDYYVVRCLQCDSKECSTYNIIDGEVVNGTILKPEISLWGAVCKNCLKEWYF